MVNGFAEVFEPSIQIFQWFTKWNLEIANWFGNFITALKWSLGQGNLFTHVCHSVHRGACVVAGGMHSCWGDGGHAWLGGVWLWGGCAWLWGGVCGCRGVHRIRRDTVTERVVRILLECILVIIMSTRINPLNECCQPEKVNTWFISNYLNSLSGLYETVEKHNLLTRNPEVTDIAAQLYHSG